VLISLSLFPAFVVSGISPNHDDGTGGSSSLGQFKFLPQYCSYGTPYVSGGSGCPTREADRPVGRVNGSVVTAPGYFHLGLASGIDSETTVKSHAVLHRFDYSDALSKKTSNLGLSPTKKTSQLEKRKAKDSKASPTLLIDLTNDLAHTYQGQGRIKVTLEADETCPEVENLATIKGYGEYLPSFGKGTYKIYFCAQVPGVLEASTYLNNTVTSGKSSLKSPLKYAEAGVLLKLDETYLKENDNVLPSRLGVSYVSEAQACNYMEDELVKWQEKSDFEEVKADARAQWNEKLTGNFRPNLKGVSQEQRRIFFSSLYRTFISPTNITGDNPRWESSERE